MINNFGMISGYRTIEVRPFKMFKKVKRVSKSKVGKRNILVSTFDRFEEKLKDGEVIKDEINMTLCMNCRTLHEFNRMWG